MKMVEKVARAIYDKVWYKGAFENDNVNGGGVHIEEALAQARAAIEAMREPTPGMRDAFLRLAERSATPDADTDAEFRVDWQAAIDAALREAE